QTPDAGEKLARSSATGADLSSIPYSCRRNPDHGFHYLHGTATDAVHVAKWRSSPTADADSHASAPHHHHLLVAGDSSCPGCGRRRCAPFGRLGRTTTVPGLTHRHDGSGRADGALRPNHDDDRRRL